MAITAMKMIRARTNRANKDGRSATREYRLWFGTANEAEEYADANIPATLTTFDSVTLYIESLEITAEDSRETVWRALVEYSSDPRREPSPVGTESVSFDISAATEQVTHSISTTNSYAASGTAPDFKQGINFDRESGTLLGTDRMVAAFSFSITKIYANASITNAYIQSLRDAAFRWNSEGFRGNAAGECLYAGASGAPRDAETYSITHKFLGVKNISGASYGDVTGITKIGWDYLWPLVEKQHDATGKFLTPRPRAVYVERLYTSVDFTTALGLSAGS